MDKEIFTEIKELINSSSINEERKEQMIDYMKCWIKIADQYGYTDIPLTFEEIQSL